MVVEQGVRDWLEGWQSGAMSMMGKVTLVRLVLSSMPVYFLTNTALPKNMSVKLEQMFRSFLWGSHSGEGGVHLLSWGIICQPCMTEAWVSSLC